MDTAIAVITALTIIVAGLMVGSELAVAAIMHPLLGRLPDDSFRLGRIAGARWLGRVMPFWYAATLVLLIVSAVVVPAGPPTWLIGTAAAVMGLVLVVTIVTLVPVNNRIAKYSDSQEPVELRQLSRLWDRLHWRRVVLLVAMFVLLVVGTVV